MANEKRLIDANALKNQFLRYVRTEPHFHWGDWQNMCIHGTEIDEVIANAPTEEAEPVVHGEWIEDYETFVQDNGYESEPIHTGFVCSVCGRHSFAIEPYCHCGAKMDGDGNA